MVSKGVEAGPFLQQQTQEERRMEDLREDGHAGDHHSKGAG